MVTAVYPGSFDPATYGHLDVIRRASVSFDRVVVGVLQNSAKSPLFSVEERVNILEKATRDIPNVIIKPFDGLSVNFARENQAQVIVRGLRAVTDFEYELQMAQTNRVLAPDVDTVFLTTSLEYAYVSSTIMKEVARFGGDLSSFAPAEIIQELLLKMQEKDKIRRVYTMSSRIEQLIDEIDEFIEGCKFQPLSATKIVVNKEEMEEYLRELRLKTPDEIKRYQKIISNKDAILEDAQAKADALIADAQTKAQELVTQHEIMQKAYAQANETINAANKQAQEILDSATQDANSIRLSAITYTDDMMANIGSVLNQTLEDAGGKYKTFIDSLQSCLEVVNHNRQELAPQTAQAAAITGSYHDEPAKEAEDDNLLDDLGEE